MSGATLSRERFLLESARQERLEREAEASRMAFAEALDAARQEGAQEMRERLIAALRNECERDQSFVDLAGPDDWERVMRALPLTPEPPK